MLKIFGVCSTCLQFKQKGNYWADPKAKMKRGEDLRYQKSLRIYNILSLQRNDINKSLFGFQSKSVAFT